MTSFTVNHRAYQPPDRPIVGICLDGSAAEYFDAALARGLMPNLQRLSVAGYRGVARGQMPSFTNVNNASIVTGVPPSVHGIGGNFFYDTANDVEVMMNSAKFLRAPTIFPAAQRAGRKVAVVTAKDKLRDIFASGLIELGGIAFSSERVSEATKAVHGIDHVEALVGPNPNIYSGEASIYVLRAGAKLIAEKRADFLYLSTTDFMQHKYAPEAREALEFYAALDEQIGQLIGLGAVVGITADHGMNAKQKPDGSPNILYLESTLVNKYGPGFRVILPITDPHVIHHGGLGSFAQVHLPPDQINARAHISEFIRQLPGVTEVLDQATAARLMELPPDRMGDLVVCSGRDLVLGRTPEWHDLKQLENGLRSHGGRYEEMVPLFLSEPLKPEYVVRAQADPRNFDLFDFICNGEHRMKLNSLIAGQPVQGEGRLEVHNPYDGSTVGSVRTATRADVESAIAAARGFTQTPTRFARSEILETTRVALAARHEEFACLITSESGLALRETRYEVGRSLDVLRFAAMEALRDDGQIFSADISPQGKARKIFTTREPLRCAAAITPFNHPLNQVAHKLAPAIAAGTPLVLKPSEKTPLTALKFAELLYAAGLPGPMLSVLLGLTSEVAEPLVRHPDIEVLAFTGSEAIGKRIAATAGYKKLVLELGGNDPLIILNDADLDLAVTLAAEGSFRNSGQRCTAVKRILVQEGIAPEFTHRFVAKAKEYVCGDPADEATRVGTVIDEAAAKQLEAVVQEAVAAGAKVLLGGNRRGAQLEPTVLSDVPRDCRMVVCESFGPLAPIVTVRDLDDALSLANATAYGLSSGVVTTNLNHALKAIKTLRCGTVNINEVPGFRVESSPFGGIKDSGLGIKEGVVEAIKAYSFVKTFSLPW